MYAIRSYYAEVQRLFRETDVLRQRIFSMGGHEDGIVAFGQTVAEAGNTLLTALTRAQQLRNEPKREGTSRNNFV